jgi:hypothetical protein
VYDIPSGPVQHPNCASGDYIFSPNSIYCPGQDGAPGTDDEYEGTALIVDGEVYDGNDNVDHVGDGVPNSDNDHNDNNELIQMLGYSLTDLYNGNVELRGELVSLFETGDIQYRKPAQLLLSHFYGISKQMPAIEIVEQQSLADRVVQNLESLNDDQIRREEVTISQLSENIFVLSSAEATWSIVYATDYIGKILDKGSVIQNGNKVHLNGVARGVYMLHVQSSGGSADTLKIMVH